LIILLFFLLALYEALLAGLLAGEAGLLEEDAVGPIYAIYLLLQSDHKTLVILLKLEYLEINLIMDVAFIVEEWLFEDNLGVNEHLFDAFTRRHLHRPSIIFQIMILQKATILIIIAQA